MPTNSSDAVALSGSDQALRTTDGYFAGYTVVETGGSNAVTVRFYDHASAASGTLVGAANVAAGSSVDVSFIRVRRLKNGLYVDCGGTGTVAGSAHFA